MKLTENQKDVFYIALTVFLAVGLGIVVFLIVKHFRNKNCTPNCNGKNCGDDGCKGNCGGCTSGQTCGTDGNCTGGNSCLQECTGKNTCGPNCKGDCGTCPLPGQSCSQEGECTGGNDCPQECNGINCGDGCTACSLDCPPGKKCTGGQCNDDHNPTCYGEGEDPFDGNAANKCKKNGCCSGLKICFNPNSKGYTCQHNTCANTTKPKCSTLPDRCENKDFCIPDTPVHLSCVGKLCTPYTCTDTCDLSKNECKGNVCRPKDYTCTLENAPIGTPNCVGYDGQQVTCRDNSCYFIYDNPNNPNVGSYGCESTEPPGKDEKNSGADGSDFVPKYCNNNEYCVGYYSDPNNWNIATDTDPDPSKCNQSLGSGYHKFMYKQKVL